MIDTYIIIGLSVMAAIVIGIKNGSEHQRDIVRSYGNIVYVHLIITAIIWPFFFYFMMKNYGKN